MLKKLCMVLSVIITASVLMVGCGPAAPTAALVQPENLPTPTAAATANTAILPPVSTLKVGLVTGSGGVNAHAFNQLAWEGLQKAAREMGFQVKWIESQQPSEDEQNIAALAAEGFNVIITAGSLMGDATAMEAKRSPNIKFAIIDTAYVPTPDSQACAETVQDCYADGGLANVTSLMFAEEQAGFLAGVLAGGMSRSGFVCSVSSLRTIQSDRVVLSFHAGAAWQAGPALKIMNNYINIKTTDKNVPTWNDSTQGKETAVRLIGKGCDVVFGVGGDAVYGAMLAARDKNVMAVGGVVDEYNFAAEARPALITSAMKNVDVAVYHYLKTVADGSVKAGITTANLQNGGVGLAPFHDWESKIPAGLKAQIQKASEGIKDGTIKIDLPPVQ